MGRAIEQEATARGHAISFRIGRNNAAQLAEISTDNTDCAIEFTQPEAAWDNFMALLPAGVPVVTGTTGWLDRKDALEAAVTEAGQAFLYSSNFSPGVNILFQLNQKLAAIMNQYPEFDCYVEEAHHRHKKDAPSGTALSLAEQVLAGLDRKTSWAGPALQDRPPKPEELSVSYTRAGEIIGEHSVTYLSDIEQVQISHRAFNRRGFALGAVLAAEWLVGKQGFFNFTAVFE